jgi:hypothetical protein
MKTIIINLCILFFTLTCVAQELKNEYKYAAKIYNLSLFEKIDEFRTDTSVFGQRNTAKNLSLLFPTVAFQFKADGKDFHEIELTNFKLNKFTTVDNGILDSSGSQQFLLRGSAITNFHISVRYEYILFLKKAMASKLVASIGFAINPFARIQKFEPMTSNAFETRNLNLGVRGFVIPRFNYFFNNRLFLDFNIPILISDYSFIRKTNRNPVIPVRQQTVSAFSFEAFAKVFSCRIGVGMKL